MLAGGGGGGGKKKKIVFWGPTQKERREKTPPGGTTKKKEGGGGGGGGGGAAYQKWILLSHLTIRKLKLDIPRGNPIKGTGMPLNVRRVPRPFYFEVLPPHPTP